jgi:hypothetical protein
VDLVGLGQVLQQLDQFIAKHDLARRRRDVLAEPKRARVDLAWAAPVVPKVADKVAGADEHASPPGFKSPLECRRVAQEKVRRRQRIGQQADREFRLCACGLVKIARGDEILG